MEGVLIFLAIIFLLLFIDLFVLHKEDKVISLNNALWASGFYILIACIFGAWLWYHFGSDYGMTFFAGYLIEKSLSIDNIFVIAAIFANLKIQDKYQHKVLFWGIITAILLRGIMIYLGLAIVTKFAWVLYLFAIFLIFMGAQMFFTEDNQTAKKIKILSKLDKYIRIDHDYDGHQFFLYKNHKLYITRLLVALIAVEFIDILFAVDSIPAIFSITTDVYIVYTSNIFAILGMRSLYFALSYVHNNFVYVKYGIATTLCFIGIKVLLSHTEYAINFMYTFYFIVFAIGSSVVLSIYKKH